MSRDHVSSGLALRIFTNLVLLKQATPQGKFALMSMSTDGKKNSVVGTSSIRRAVQIKKLRPDLKLKEIRGNVGTRINKLKNGEFDAIILAHAGLKRLKINKKL